MAVAAFGAWRALLPLILVSGGKEDYPPYEFREDGEAEWPVLQERLSPDDVQDLHVRWFHVEHCTQRRPFTEPIDNSTELATVEVVYASDRNNFEGLMASMVSLARHLESSTKCVLHVIVPRPDMKAALKMRRCFLLQISHLKHAVTVTLHEERSIPFVLEARGPNRTTLTYARMYAEQYFPTQARVLYLDTDTILKADVSPLFRTRMQYPVAAVKDIGRYSRQYSNPRASQIFTHPFEVLFNAGVLLIDLRRWRAQRIYKVLEEMALAHPELNDQEVLNAAFQNFYDFLSWKWNLQALCFAFRWPKFCLDDARLLHFTGIGKPWQPASKGNWCVLHADLYEPAFKCQY